VRDAGHRTAILSNDAVDWRPAWDALLRTTDQFEHVVRSSAIGMRKPDPRIYAHVLDLLDVEAGDALFLDDFEPMVAGARAVGMHAIHVVDHDAAIAEARTMLGLVA
jgi:putative hydrolase of the HAD superfamily